MTLFQALSTTSLGNSLLRNLRWIRMSRKKELLRRLQPSRSFVVQVCSAGGLAVTSDVVCQLMVEKVEKYDLHRTLRFGLVTVALIGPIQFLWFRFLSRTLVPDVKHKSNFNTGLRRMLVDQTVCAPLLTSAFIFTLSALESRNATTSFERTKSLLLPILVTNYKVWPLVQLINMSVVPLKFRVVFVQFIAMFWNMYISFMTHKRE